MARMVPPRKPDAFKSRAERTLYRELEQQLSDDYVVLHSVSWVARQGNRNQDGEADFVIAHPKQGVLIVEVKGGTISRDGVSGAWSSTDEKGETHAIKDPFEQATVNQYSLRDKLAEAEATAGFRYHIARTVAFPEVLVGQTDLGPDAPRELIIDSSDLARIVKALQRAWGSPALGTTGRQAVDALVKALRPPVELNRVGLVGAMRAEHEEQLVLTAEQTRVLEHTTDFRRLAVKGGAGSGKTLVAMEAAKRFARDGKRVLFTCFTRALADAVAATLTRDLGAEMDRVEVDNYHDLAERFACQAGFTLPDPSAMNGDETAHYYNETLPQLLTDAISTLSLRFDAIVVDEGQDFADTWWVTLEELFADPDEGSLFVFYDENQRLFDQSGALPIPPPHHRLSSNCRTTRAIHQAAARYLRVGGPATCEGPAGRAPVEIAVENGDEADALRRAIHELVAVEGVPLHEIVVLTPRSNRTSVLLEGTKLGNASLTWGEAGEKQIRCRSIASFKGLESPVVILAEPGRAHAARADSLIHVALTRAKHHVVVLGRLPAPRAAG